MSRISNAARVMLTCLVFCWIGSGTLHGQGDPVEMNAGKSRTFNRHRLKVLDGPMKPASRLPEWPLLLSWREPPRRTPRF